MDSKELKKILAAINQVDDSKLEGIDFELKMNGKPVEYVDVQVFDQITLAEKACGCLLVLIITLLFAFGIS